jgi:hypothetical protein
VDAREGALSHLLRGANIDGFLKPLFLIEVLEEVQGVLRLAHSGSVLGRRLSLRIDFKIDAMLRVVGTCVSVRRALRTP